MAGTGAALARRPIPGSPDEIDVICTASDDVVVTAAYLSAR